jgi:hypothetical protein
MSHCYNQASLLMMPYSATLATIDLIIFHAASHSLQAELHSIHIRHTKNLAEQEPYYTVFTVRLTCFKGHLRQSQ